MSFKQHKVRVGISIGDFNGIGPEIIMKSLKDKAITDFFTPIILYSEILYTDTLGLFLISLIIYIIIEKMNCFKIIHLVIIERRSSEMLVLTPYFITGSYFYNF